MHLHKRFIYKAHTSTRAQGTDPSVALWSLRGALLDIYIGA